MSEETTTQLADESVYAGRKSRRAALQQKLGKRAPSGGGGPIPPIVTKKKPQPGKRPPRRPAGRPAASTYKPKFASESYWKPRSIRIGRTKINLNKTGVGVHSRIAGVPIGMTTGGVGAEGREGPIEGQTKQGAKGTLIFRNHRWHRVETPTSAAYGQARAAAATQKARGAPHVGEQKKYRVPGGQAQKPAKKPSGRGEHVVQVNHPEHGKFKILVDREGNILKGPPALKKAGITRVKHNPKSQAKGQRFTTKGKRIMPKAKAPGKPAPPSGAKPSDIHFLMKSLGIDQSAAEKMLATSAEAKQAAGKKKEATAARMAGLQKEQQQQKPKGHAFGKGVTRNWRAGMNSGSVTFDSLKQRDAYDFRAHQRAVNLGKRQPKNTVHGMDAKGLAATHGMTPDEWHTYSHDTYTHVKESMKGLKEGESRIVPERAVSKMAPKASPEEIAKKESAKKYERELKESAEKRSAAVPKRGSGHPLAKYLDDIPGDQDREAAYETIMDVHKVKAEPIERRNEAWESLIDNYVSKDAKGSRRGRGSFMKKLKKAADPNDVDGFDEMKRTAEENPEDFAILFKDSDFAAGDMEYMLAEEMKKGRMPVPQPWDKEVIDEAFKIIDRSVSYEGEEEGEDFSHVTEEDLDKVPFSEDTPLWRRRVIMWMESDLAEYQS